MLLTERHAEFRDQLLAAGLLVKTSSSGLYGRSGAFESIVDGMNAVVTQLAADQSPMVVRFPAVFPRDVFEKTDYIASFPDLTGAIFTFTGNDKDHKALLAEREDGHDWSHALTPSDLMLVSAACHPCYPMLAGELPEGGRHLDVLGLCFRHEPSIDPARMQAFRQREIVFVGTPIDAVAHRDLWADRAQTILRELGLDANLEVANDPFFGRAGRILAAGQREEELKFEVVVRLYGDSDDGESGSGTAVASSNCHLDHFGTPFAIRTSDGEVAHSACVGFGLERITLALLRTHGLDVEAWPDAVRSRLWG